MNSRALLSALLGCTALSLASAQESGGGDDVRPAPASIGADVPVTYFGPSPSQVQKELVGPLQLRERPGARLLGLAGVAFAGVVFVALAEGRGGRGDASVLGVGLVLVSTLIYALYDVLGRRAAIRCPPLLLTAWQQSAGLVAGVALWLVLAGGETVPRVGAGVWLLAALSGVTQYGVTLWLFLIALRGVSASVASFFLTLGPVFGVAGGVLFLGEGLSPARALGAALILGAALSITRLRGPPEGTP
ncbi:hypothetical protein DAETH_36670 (plasmid) [Deinococcus aetherius]|uniref:EamA domain-containing protein n=1 Tax=Deinococcus aetherius TaxID=200252 RepID=A0ABN6RLT4_9DEIO|nr:DMT family transporter [Deinococcus aetherius]BDP43698.1 hypothetical protein DAETH_36670 [Deinococcus aetherius]